MIYVLVDSLRMTYVQNLLNAAALIDPDEIKAGDIIVFPILDKSRRTITLQKGILQLYEIEKCKLFLPFPYPFFRDNNEIFYYMRDEELVTNNARLTAMGLISLLGTLKLSLKDTSFDIIGKGKCGTAIASILNAMHLKYSIIRYTKTTTNQMNTCSIENYKNKKKAMVIINTAPYNILKKEDFIDCKTLYIIDISSEKCFKQDCIPKSISLIYPGSLPNKYFTYSSAVLIADFVKGR